MTTKIDPPAWAPLTPALEPGDLEALKGYLLELDAPAVTGPAARERAGALEALRDAHLRRVSPTDEAAYAAAACVLTDLVAQGYAITPTEDGLAYRAPAGLRGHEANKARTRARLMIERDEQLRQRSVREFISKMERRRLHGARFCSIFSLMRDGRELSAALEAKPAALEEVIDPYLQVIEGEERCAHTGLKLRDIWRYFRHTWVTAYKSTPGRSMAVLIRDRAAQDHPVIGIASISSAAIQISQRDAWIGWQPEAPEVDDDTARWLREVVAQAIEELYLDDFYEESLMVPSQLKAPPGALIEALTEDAERAKATHKRLGVPSDHKGEVGGEGYWEAQARTPLYRSKRAEALAWLLEARAALASLPEGADAAQVRSWLEGEAGARTHRRVLRKAKADRVGISLADINVCGAIPPYNDLLGGKLVCALLTSAELIDAYRRRYEGAASIIASSMAGRALRRPAELVLLCTTSLYGRSSQYNRLKIPAGDGHFIRYEEIGVTEGFGTHQFGQETVARLNTLLAQRAGGQRVNSVFGEGVNPRLRKIRAGLTALGLPQEALLHHGQRRALYAVPVAKNFRAYLRGQASAPEYYSATAPEAATAAIAAWWRARWLSKRVHVEGVLARVAAHTLVHPIDHGARVRLPEEDDGAQLSWL